jgi:hypothetical protein
MSAGDWVNVGCAVLTGSIVAAWIGCGQSVQDASASVGMSMISKAGSSSPPSPHIGFVALWQRVPHRGNVVDAVPFLAQLLPRADPQLALRLVGATRLSEPVDLSELPRRDETVVVHVLDVHVVMDDRHGEKLQVLCWSTEPGLCCFP